MVGRRRWQFECALLQAGMVAAMVGGDASGLSMAYWEFTGDRPPTVAVQYGPEIDREVAETRARNRRALGLAP